MKLKLFVILSVANQRATDLSNLDWRRILNALFRKCKEDRYLDALLKWIMLLREIEIRMITNRDNISKMPPIFNHQICTLRCLIILPDTQMCSRGTAKRPMAARIWLDPKADTGHPWAAVSPDHKHKTTPCHPIHTVEASLPPCETIITEWIPSNKWTMATILAKAGICSRVRIQEEWTASCKASRIRLKTTCTAMPVWGTKTCQEATSSTKTKWLWGRTRYNKTKWTKLLAR